MLVGAEDGAAMPKRKEEEIVQSNQANLHSIVARQVLIGVISIKLHFFTSNPLENPPKPHGKPEKSDQFLSFCAKPTKNKALIRSRLNTVISNWISN